MSVLLQVEDIENWNSYCSWITELLYHQIIVYQEKNLLYYT